MEGTAFARSIAVEELGDAFAGDGTGADEPAPAFATMTAAIIPVTPTRVATAAVTPSRVGNRKLPHIRAARRRGAGCTSVLSACLPVLTSSLPPPVSDRKVHIQLPTVITLILAYAAKHAGK